MAQPAKLVHEALTAFEKLSLSTRRRLAERLLERSRPSARTVLVAFEQFDPATEARLQYLMDRSNEGTLGRAERRELDSLVLEHQHMMLANSEALLRVSRPDLFDTQGHLVPARLDKAVREKASRLRSRRSPQRLTKSGPVK